MDVREKLVELLQDENNPVWMWLPNNASMMQLTDYLASNGVTVQEWISVKDRLPEQPPNRVDEQGRSWFTPDTDCIVYDGENVFAANYCFQNKCFWYTNSLEPLNNITHWMPMPQPPKGGNMQ